MQQRILNADEEAQSIETTYDLINQTYCMRSVLSDEEITELNKNLNLKTYNTVNRLRSYLLSQENFRGKMLVYDKDETIYHEYCD